MLSEMLPQLVCLQDAPAHLPFRRRLVVLHETTFGSTPDSSLIPLLLRTVASEALIPLYIPEYIVSDAYTTYLNCPFHTVLFLPLLSPWLDPRNPIKISRRRRLRRASDMRLQGVARK